MTLSTERVAPPADALPRAQEQGVSDLACVVSRFTPTTWALLADTARTVYRRSSATDTEAVRHRAVAAAWACGRADLLLDAQRALMEVVPLAAGPHGERAVLDALLAMLTADLLADGDFQVLVEPLVSSAITEIDVRTTGH